jgi:hypothetical protein
VATSSTSGKPSQMSLPTTTTREYALGRQAWAGTSEPDPSRGASGWPKNPTAKPDGGFFTSTWNETTWSSPWLDHLSDPESQVRRNPVEEGRALWLLDPDPDAVLVVIDSSDDFELLAMTYPHRWNDRHPTLPNWGDIVRADLFDAVHVTRNVTETPLRSWACESTLWLKCRLATFGCAGELGEGWKVARRK